MPDIAPVPCAEFRTWFETVLPGCVDVAFFRREFVAGRQQWVPRLAGDKPAPFPAEAINAKTVRRLISMGARRLPENPDDDSAGAAPVLFVMWSDF